MLKKAKRIYTLCEDYLNNVAEPKHTDPFWKILDKETESIQKQFDEFNMSCLEHFNDQRYLHKLLQVTATFDDIAMILEEISDKMI